MASVPLSKDVPKIYVPSLSVPNIRTPKIHVPKISTPGKGSYRLPEREHVKDLGDLILGNPITGTKQLRHTLQDAGYEEWINVPLLNRLVGFSVMSKERFIEPALEGKPGDVFINALETFGSSLDLVANPVKSLMPWAGGGSSTDLLKSMGWIEDEYRETYQWDTGNWAVDLVGEIISDPINWFTFGSNAALKSSAGVTDDIARAIIKDLPEEAVSTRTVVNLIDEFTTHIGDDSTRIIENYITKQKNQLDDLYKQLNKANIKNSQRTKLIQQTTVLQDEVDEIGYLMNTLTPDQQAALFTRKGILGTELDAEALEMGYRNISPKQREELIQKLVDASQSRGYNTYKVWRNINKVAHGADELLMKASLYTTLPFGLSKITYSLLAKPLFRALWNKAILALENANLSKSLDISTNKVSRVKQELLREVNAAYQRTVKDWDQFLIEHGYSVDKARKLWLTIYNEAADTITDINIINARFIEELIRQVPELRYVPDAAEQLAARTLDDVVDSDVVESLAKQLSIDDFIDYNSTAGTINTYIDTQAIGAVRDRLAQDVKAFWANKHKGYKIIGENIAYADLDPIDVLYYVDESLLRRFNGLAHLDKMIAELSKTNQKLYQSYLALLNYMGITLDNYKEVNKLLSQLKQLNPESKEYKELYKTLKNKLIKSKTGDLLMLDAIEQNKKSFESYVDKHVEQSIRKKTKTGDTDEVLQRLTYAQEDGWRYVETDVLDEQGNIPTTQVVKETKKSYDINIQNLQENLDDFIKITEPKLKSNKRQQAILSYLHKQGVTRIGHNILNTITNPITLTKRNIVDKTKYPTIKKIKRLSETDIDYAKEILEDHEMSLKEFLERNSILADAVYYTKYKPSINEALDDAFGYAGTQDFQYDIGVDTNAISYMPSTYSFSQAIESCVNKAKAFAKELKSITTHDPDIIIEKHADFINELRTLKEAVHRAQYNINKELQDNVGKNVRYSVEVRQFINDLDTLLTNITDTGITSLNVADIKTIADTAYGEGSDVIYLKMSQENTLAYIDSVFNRELMNSELYQALSDPNSRLRQSLLYMCDSLAKNEDTLTYVTDIKEILSTIDNINLYNEIMSTPFCSFTDVPDTLLDFVKGEFFNRIYAAAKEKQPRFEYVIDDIMQRFNENLRNQRDVHMWLDQMNFDEETKKFIFDDITSIFKSKLNEYIKGLDRIRINNKLPTISFFKNFLNTNLVQRMHHLGLDYEIIMQHIINTDPDLLVSNTTAIIDISQFITGSSARVSDEARDSINKLVDSILSKSNINNARQLINYLIDNLRYLHGSALVTQLEQYFNDIAEVNGQLQRRMGILGTVAGDKVFNIHGYMLKNDINQALRLTSDTTNTYVYSTIGGNAFKTFVTNEELVQHKLAALFFNEPATNEEYTMFLSNWKHARKQLEKRVFRPDEKYIQQLRNNLIDVYTRIGNDPAFNTFVIPKNPREYFYYMSAEDILVWDYITSKSRYNSRIASRYTEIKRHRIIDTDFDMKAQYRMNPLSIVTEYESTVDAVTSAEHITSILNKTDLQHLNLQVDCINTDYKKNIKDLETLGVHRNMFVNLINQDTDAVSGIAELQNIANDARFVRDLIDIDSLDDMTRARLNAYFGTEHFGDLQINDKRVQNYLKAEISWDLYESVKSYDAFQLRAYIDNECSGELFISNPKYDLDYDWLHKFDNKTLEEAGLKVWQDPEEPTRFIIRRTDNRITKTDYNFKKHKSFFKKQRMLCLRVIKKAQHYFYNNGMRLPYDLYTGDMITENAVNTIKKSEKYLDIFGDATEQKLYSNWDKTGSNRFFEKNIPRPNAMFIGDPNCYNDFMGTVADAYKSTEDVFIPKTMDLPRSIATGVVQATKMVNTQHKLLSLVANDDFYIGNSTFRPVFEKASNKELKQFFEDNSFVACVVKQNKQGEPKVYKIYIDNKKMLEQAIKNKALILPYEIYRSMVLGINRGKAQNKLINVYTRFIAGTYKSIWLSTPGFIMRNALDSMLYKNMSSTTGASGLFDVLKYEYKAAKITDWYDDIYKKAIALRKADGGFETPNMQYIRKVLKQMPEEDKKMFLLMLAFEKSGGSAGLTETVEQAMLNYNKAMARGVDAVDDTIVDLLYKTTPNYWISRINSKVERISRLGLLLNLMDNGVSKSDAFRRVIDTHFDYELAEAELGFVGQVFWFITFPIKNSLYYLNEGLTRNPEMLKIQIDAMEQSWNSREITWDDVRHSDYLRYNAMTGNIRFKFNGKNLVLKTGSSVLDFFKVLYDPIGAAKERLNPFLSVLLGLDETSELNPLSSVSNRIDQIRKGRSLIPSVYTTLYNRNNYFRKPYIEKKPFVYNSSWRPKKPRKVYFSKPDNMKRMRYRFSIHRYYFTKGKHLHRYTSAWSSVDPTWYSNNYKYRKLYRRYNKLPDFKQYSDLR